MKKRFLALILAMSMAFSLMSTSAFALEVEGTPAADSSFALYSDAYETQQTFSLSSVQTGAATISIVEDVNFTDAGIVESTVLP